MKKLLLTTLFLLTILAGFAQSDSILNKKITFGANISYYQNFDLNFKDGFLFSTALEIKKTKHSLSLAPVWWIDKNIDVNFFKGGLLSYKFFTIKKQKYLNFYFIYDLMFTFEKNDWERNMLYLTNQYFDVSFKSTWHSLKNQIGYGFNINIYKGFYINQGMSFGAEFYNYSSKTDVKDSPDLSSEYSSGNIFSNLKASSYLKIGVGYNFEK